MSDFNKIVLFDGVCNFCESSVQFIIKHDKSNSLKFASLQSTIGQQLLTEYKMSKALDGVVFVENGKAYFKSSAAFKIANYFGGFLERIISVQYITNFHHRFFL